MSVGHRSVIDSSSPNNINNNNIENDITGNIKNNNKSKAAINNDNEEYQWTWRLRLHLNNGNNKRNNSNNIYLSGPLWIATAISMIHISPFQSHLC